MRKLGKQITVTLKKKLGPYGVGTLLGVDIVKGERLLHLMCGGGCYILDYTDVEPCEMLDPRFFETDED